MTIATTPSPTFGGLTGRTLQSQFVVLSESEYPSGLTQPKHGHLPSYFTAVVAGGYQERIGNRSRDVEAGALLFHPSEEEHAVRFDAPHTRIFRIQPRNAMLHAAKMVGLEFDKPMRVTSVAMRDTVQCLRSAFAATDPLTPLLVDELACRMVATLAQRDRCTSRRNVHPAAEQARKYVDACPARIPSLAELAIASGCHPMTLARVFRRAFGSSIGEYARRRQLQYACRLMRDGDLPLTMIAAEAGFADQAHLTRALRNAIGVTPAAWRRRVRA